MLLRLIELKDSVEYVLMDVQKFDVMLDPSEWNEISQLCRLLKPMQIATDFTLGQSYPTIGTVSMLISSIINALKSKKPPTQWSIHIPHWIDEIIPNIEELNDWSETCSIVQSVRQYLLNDISRRWDVGDMTLGMC